MDINLNDIDSLFAHLPAEQAFRAKTVFLKKLSLKAHSFYGGKIETLPKAALPSPSWYNVWYTPGVSAVSTTIRDDNSRSFDLSNRRNLVAIVTDSTRVLGDGDCTPPGGLGVMEGKAYLMKLLGGVDAVSLCIDSRDENGVSQPQKIIDFVLAAQPSFGAVNLEDISQPNCYEVLDTLRKQAKIPVWHDDAQGTACVILAGLINSLKLARKKIEDVKIVLFGSGASNTMVAHLLLQMGANPKKMIVSDSKGPLHSDRTDVRDKKGYYKQWDLAQRTNPEKISCIKQAFNGADVLIALSKPGPDTVKKEWVQSMADKKIVFTCANPVPEIMPSAAKDAGALVVATGRGDFPNQLNNSVCFPAILKGALLCGATTITDNMAIECAKALAACAEKKGLREDYIIPSMDESEVFPIQAAAVVQAAQKDGVATIKITPEEAASETEKSIKRTQDIFKLLSEKGFIAKPTEKMAEEALKEALEECAK